MPDLDIQSTTDTPEAVTAAYGKPSEVKEPEVTKEPEPEKPTTDDSETSDKKEVEEPEEKPEEAAKKKGGFQRRIDKLTSESYQLQGRNAELERQLAALTAVKPADQPKVEATSEPKAEDFDSYEKYIRAVAKYDLKQELAAERQAQAQASEQKRLADKQADFQKQTQTAKDKYEDFDEVISNPNVPITNAMRDYVLESDQAAELAYQLGKNPAEATRIAQLSPIAQMRELAKLEAKISTPVTATAADSPKVTKAPAPITPVGTKASPSSKDPGEMDFQEYKKWRNSNK